MAKGSTNTYYLVGLILSLVGNIGLAFLTHTFNEDLTQAKADATKAREDAKKENEEVKRKAKQLNDLRMVITGDAREISADQIKTMILDPANKKLEEILAGEWVTSDDVRSIQDQALRTAWENISGLKGKQPAYSSVVDLFSDRGGVYDQLTALTHVIPRLRVERFRAREELKSLRTEKEQDRSRLEGELGDMRGQKNHLQDQVISLEREYDQSKRGLQEKVEGLQQELGRLERDRRLEEARLISEVSKLNARIDDLTKKERRTFGENSTPDGEVVYADAALGYAWINLGRRHGLRPNTPFQVYQFVKGGRQKLKGRLEVRRVEEDMAQCAIIEDVTLVHPITGEQVHVPDPNDPVVKGDLIRTPLFDPHEQKTFVFLGASPKNRYYNREELEQKLREFGARVEPAVTIESDFVVLLGGTEEDAELQEQIKQAARFGVTFIVEDELLEYLGAR